MYPPFIQDFEWNELPQGQTSPNIIDDNNKQTDTEGVLREPIRDILDKKSELDR